MLNVNLSVTMMDGIKTRSFLKESDEMSQDIKKQEEAHLAFVYRELEKTYTYLKKWLENTKSSSQHTMKHITEDIKLNVDGISDKLDSFSQIEMKNREIDQLNIKIRNGELTFDKVERLLESPYFGKIGVDFLEDEPAESFYIGMNGFATESGDNLIYDWRSPIAALFYNNELGRSSYQVNKNTIHASIEERRQFVIEKNKLITLFDTLIAIQDDVLLEALASDDTEKMKDITATIQQEQNEIIRDLDHSYLLVNGVAGSGKTSAIMQRIAFLLYTLRSEITSDNVLILSPNRSFITYVSDVLPALGEKNPLNMTILQLVDRYLRLEIEDEDTYFTRIVTSEVDKQTAHLRSREFVDYIKEQQHDSFSPEEVLKPIMHRGKPVISKRTIIQHFLETPEEGTYLERIQAVKQRLLSYWERKILEQSRSKRVQDQVLDLTEEQQEAYFGHMITNDSEKSLIRYGERLIRKRYKKVLRDINRFAWLDEEALVNTLYEGFSEEPYKRQARELSLDEAVIALMVHHLFVEKLSLPSMRFVLVDEVQDYTPAQMSLLLTLFPNTDFTLVGDENQAIFNSSIAFKDIRALFEQENKTMQPYELLTSYRSTGSITRFFNQLTTTKDIDIVPVRSEGKEPIVFEYQSVYDLRERVKIFCEEHVGSELTILTKTEEEVILLEGVLSSYLDHLTIIPVSLAKGLEFDFVLIPNVSADHFVTERDKKILYTACSRAMRELYIGYEGSPSNFI